MHEVGSGLLFKSHVAMNHLVLNLCFILDLSQYFVTVGRWTTLNL
jgi:hypothetical protein